MPEDDTQRDRTDPPDQPPAPDPRDQGDQRTDSADALAAMANGEDLGLAEYHELEETHEADDTADVADPVEAIQGYAGGDPLENAGMENEPVAAASSRVDRGKRAAAGPSTHHQFKAVMVPLLLTVGVLLILLGGASLGLMMRSRSADGFQKIVTYAAFPVGLVLLVGALLFRRDVRRHGR